MQPGTDMDGKMIAASRRLGFDRVFDTCFTADLTIMEEGSECSSRHEGGTLPMFTSCSPGWIKFVEKFYPDFIHNLSTCKSPQQMMGAVIKSFFARREGIDPAESSASASCPARPRSSRPAGRRWAGTALPTWTPCSPPGNWPTVPHAGSGPARAWSPKAADTPFGERTTAGKLFGASGGVMEAALRTAYFLVTGEEMGNLESRPSAA